jgi:hypothetical protein
VCGSATTEMTSRTAGLDGACQPCLSFTSRAALGASVMTSEAYRKLGTTDKVTTCEFCGRENLSSTAVLEVHGDHGQIIGTRYACAACTAQATRSA